MGTASTVVDRRTGEILKANAYVGENYDAGRDWYFTMVAPLDPRAQRLPLPDSLIGALYQRLVTHEVGHALGIRDGSYGKFAYPVDSLRSVGWLARMGFTPSIMNYTRFNYVPQPEDSIPPDLLMPRVGPADIYTIRWGYTPIPEVRTPDEEKSILDSWARIQDTVPWFRFAGRRNEELYTMSYDAADNADPIRSTELGLKNLRRVMEILPGATLSAGSDNALLERLYRATLNQWLTELKSVAELIGGFTAQYKSGSQPGPVYTPVPAAEQRAAMRFLDSAAFRVPEWLIAPQITRRFEASGTVSRIISMQASVLGSLLSVGRLNRMVELEATASSSKEAYSVLELLTDIRRSLWSELAQTNVVIGPYRGAIQQTHVTLLLSQMKGTRNATLTPYKVEWNDNSIEAYTGQSLMHVEVEILYAEIAKVIPRAADPTTRAHLKMMKDRIYRVLKEQ